MYIKAFVELSVDPLNVLGNFKIQEMCDDTVRRKNPTRCHVSDFFVKPKQVNRWYDDNDYWNDY